MGELFTILSCVPVVRKGRLKVTQTTLTLLLFKQPSRRKSHHAVSPSESDTKVKATDPKKTKITRAQLKKEPQICDVSPSTVRDSKSIKRCSENELVGEVKKKRKSASVKSLKEAEGCKGDADVVS